MDSRRVTKRAIRTGYGALRNFIFEFSNPSKSLDRRDFLSGYSDELVTRICGVTITLLRLPVARLGAIVDNVVDKVVDSAGDNAVDSTVNNAANNAVDKAPMDRRALVGWLPSDCLVGSADRKRA